MVRHSEGLGLTDWARCTTSEKPSRIQLLSNNNKATVLSTELWNTVYQNQVIIETEAQKDMKNRWLVWSCWPYFVNTDSASSKIYENYQIHVLNGLCFICIAVQMGRVLKWARDDTFEKNWQMMLTRTTLRDHLPLFIHSFKTLFSLVLYEEKKQSSFTKQVHYHITKSKDLQCEKACLMSFRF